MFDSKLQKATDAYLRELSRAPIYETRREANELIRSLRGAHGPLVTLGETDWGESVSVPIEQLVTAHSMITGATGSGKTMACAILIKALVDLLPDQWEGGFGLVDVEKCDLFSLCTYFLSERLAYLSKHSPSAAKELRRRIVICDFASSDPIHSFNLLARWPNTETEFFALSRADLLLDLLPGRDQMSGSGDTLLKKLLLLLSEFDLPITYLDEVLQDSSLRERLIARSKNSSVDRYFSRQFPEVPKATIAALRRRVEMFLASGSVRLALQGPSAPDFRALQDEGRIVLIRCGGTAVSSSVRQLLQALVFSDIHQSVFRRKQPSRPFLWCLDESQAFFATERLKEQVGDMLRLSRSFGSFFMFLTQNMGAAVRDSRPIKLLVTNLRWLLTMRVEPEDCQFLRPALPVTGRMLRPQTDPFQERKLYTLAEERTLALDGINNLPDRTGYFWFKALTGLAIRIRTQELALPGKPPELELAALSLRNDPSIGMRYARKEYERRIAERDREWLITEETNLSEGLKDAYRKSRRGAL